MEKEGGQDQTEAITTAAGKMEGRAVRVCWRAIIVRSLGSG